MNASAWQHDLTAEQVEARIRKLASEGWGDHQIASLFGVHVEQIRRIIGCQDCGE